MGFVREAGGAYVVSYDWIGATLALSLPVPSFAEVVRLPGQEVLARTAERNTAAWVRLDNLPADTPHELEARWEGGARTLSFRTLPAPEGSLLSSYAVVADPHVSEKTENRKGRLFVEAASILRDAVEDINALRVDGVFIAGDLTNAATEREFAVARRILDGLRCPCFIAPGDHDLPGGDSGRWRAALGATEGLGAMAGLTAVTLNTAAGELGDAGRRLIEEALARRGRGIVVLSHFQLLEDGFIRHGKRKRARDADRHADLWDALTQRTTLLYAGHQNVASRVERGGLMQLNLPQPCQFPCGWVLVREYKNGFYHTFRPIRSAALNETSRAAGNAAAALYGEPQWREEYRLGRDAGQANFLFAPNPPERET